MNVRTLVLALLALALPHVAAAQRVCTLVLQPTGSDANTYTEAARRTAIQVRVAGRVVAVAQPQQQPLTVVVGAVPVTREAIEGAEPYLAGFEHRKGAATFDAATCSGTLSLTPFRVWKVHVSTTATAADVTLIASERTKDLPASAKDSSTGKALSTDLPAGKSLAWNEPFELAIALFTPALPSVVSYPVTLTSTTFGHGACNNTASNYFCHDPNKVKSELINHIPDRGSNSWTATAVKKRLAKQIEALSLPQIDFQLVTP